MSTIAPQAQDPLAICGTPTPPGPVVLPLELQRAWSSGSAGVRPPDAIVVEVTREQGPPPWGVALGALPLLLTVWFVLRRWRSGGTPQEVATEEITDEAQVDDRQEADVIPLRRRKKPDAPKPIVVPLGGHRPKAKPVTVLLPAHAARMLTRSRTSPPPNPTVDPGSHTDGAVEEASPPEPQKRDRDDSARQRSWWVMD